MPCGGIDWTGPYPGMDCFACGKSDPPPDHWVEEWDAAIHADCIEAFLATPEGQIVVKHGHAVYKFGTLISGKEGR